MAYGKGQMQIARQTEKPIDTLTDRQIDRLIAPDRQTVKDLQTDRNTGLAYLCQAK